MSCIITCSCDAVVLIPLAVQRSGARVPVAEIALLAIGIGFARLCDTEQTLFTLLGQQGMWSLQLKTIKLVDMQKCKDSYFICLEFDDLEN